LKLLKLGLPWDYLQTLTHGEVMMILGVENAIAEKEQEDQQAEMGSMHMPSLTGFGV